LRHAALLLSLLFCNSCANGHTTSADRGSGDPRIATQTHYGIGCRGHHIPGTPWNPHPPPLSYNAKDVGKSDIPALTSSEAAVLKRIQRYIHSDTLRVAWLNPGQQGSFIVFDATDGPCADFGLGYEVLNGSCHEFYQPGENPYFTNPGPPEGITCKRPWL